VDHIYGRNDVGLRDTVMPAEVIFIPVGPKEAQHCHGAGYQIADATQDELARLRRSAFEADDSKMGDHHSRRGAAHDAEQGEILGVEQNRDGRANEGVQFYGGEASAEGGEKSQDGRVGYGEDDGVNQAGAVASGDGGDGVQVRIGTRFVMLSAEWDRFGM